jgi:hypothetical protein
MLNWESRQSLKTQQNLSNIEKARALSDSATSVSQLTQIPIGKS